ncbi:MAG: hypothetical protein P3W87_004755 [Gammaproteobacteria bacterium]|nr:hypothetical protein [Gammaproteobacteria bacterium]
MSETETMTEYFVVEEDDLDAIVETGERLPPEMRDDDLIEAVVVKRQAPDGEEEVGLGSGSTGLEQS